MWLELLGGKPLTQILWPWLAERYLKCKELLCQRWGWSWIWSGVHCHNSSQCGPSVSFMISFYGWECITGVFGSMCVFVWNQAKAWVLCPCCNDTRLSKHSQSLGIRCDCMDGRMAPSQTLKGSSSELSFQEAVTAMLLEGTAHTSHIHLAAGA